MMINKRSATMVSIFVLVLIIWFTQHGRVHSVPICLVGQVQHRLQGNIPDTLRSVHIDAKKIGSGFGNISMIDWTSLGDGIILNGQAWLRSTNQKSPRYYQVINNRFFKTNYLVYLPQKTKPDFVLTIEDKMSMADLWTSLARNYGNGIYVSGYIKFNKLNTIAIARPPVDTNSVLQDPARYYTQPMETLDQTWAYVVGIAARRKPRFWWQQRTMLNRAIASINKEKWYIGLAQAAIIKGVPADLQTAPSAAQIQSVGQLVMHSEIQRAQLSLYPIDKITACRSAYHRP